MVLIIILFELIIIISGPSSTQLLDNDGDSKLVSYVIAKYDKSQLDWDIQLFSFKVEQNYYVSQMKS